MFLTVLDPFTVNFFQDKTVAERVHNALHAAQVSLAAARGLQSAVEAGKLRLVFAELLEPDALGVAQKKQIHGFLQGGQLDFAVAIFGKEDSVVGGDAQGAQGRGLLVEDVAKQQRAHAAVAKKTNPLPDLAHHGKCFIVQPVSEAEPRHRQLVCGSGHRGGSVGCGRWRRRCCPMLGRRVPFSLIAVIDLGNATRQCPESVFEIGEPSASYRCAQHRCPLLPVGRGMSHGEDERGQRARFMAKAEQVLAGVVGHRQTLCGEVRRVVVQQALAQHGQVTEVEPPAGKGGHYPVMVASNETLEAGMRVIAEKNHLSISWLKRQSVESHCGHGRRQWEHRCLSLINIRVSFSRCVYKFIPTIHHLFCNLLNSPLIIRGNFLIQPSSVLLSAAELII